MLTSILQELESFLIEKDYPIIKKLNEGITKNEVVNSLKQFDLDVRQELIDLYTWKNGIDGLYEEYFEEELSLFNMGIMLPFQFAVDTYVRGALKEKYFKKNFFPLFTSGEDYILIDLQKRRSSENLFIYSPSLFIMEPMTIYDSLEKLFETVLLTYQNNGYYFNGDNLEVDFEILTKIAIELNPKSEFWEQ